MEDDIDETTAFQKNNDKIRDAEEPGVETKLTYENIAYNNSETKQDAALDTKLTTFRNLSVVCISFLLLFSAFLSLANLQSSINVAEGLGTTGLTFVFITKVMSSLFLPPLVLSKMGMKWTMCISMFGYIAYIGASFHASWSTIVPTSFLLGVGASNLWPAQMNYVTELCRRHTNIYTELRQSEALSRFFGIFFAVFHTGDVWGNLVSSLVFSHQRIDNTTERNSSCGISFCAREESENKNLLVTDRMKIYIYSGFCLGCGLLGVLLMAIMLDNLKSSQTIKSSPWKLLTGVVRHIWKSGYQQLLIPVTIYRGLSPTFLMGDFNAAYVSCSLGVEKVGFVMICNGLSCSISSLLFGKVTRMTGYHVPFIIAFIIHGALGITLFLWTPSKDKAYVFYIYVGVWAVGYAVYSATLSPLYSQMFPKKTAAAMSCFDLFHSFGCGVSFGLSSFLCTRAKLIIVLSTLVLATGCVLVAVLHHKYDSKTRSSD